MAELAYQQSLTQAGLDKNQALVYEALVKLGPSPASDIARAARIGRPLTYKVLDELVSIGLAEEKKEPKRVTRFISAHPLKLKEVVEKRLEQAEGARVALDGVLGKLTSDFNLQSGKPGVRFFEGMEGIREVLWDSLTAKETINAYSDLAAIRQFIPEINKEYVAERIRLGINKHGLVLDTPENRSFMQEYAGKMLEMTETRFLPCDKTPFSTIMQIYDNKVSYAALGGGNLIGVIIENPRIYSAHRTLFEYLWSITPAVTPTP